MSTSLQLRIQTVQTGIQTVIQTVVKYIQTIQTVKDNQFLSVDLLYRVFSGLYGLYVFLNSLYAGLYPGLYSLYGT